MKEKPLLQFAPRQPGEQCTHPALRSTGPGSWQCVICQTNLTDRQLLDERNERRTARRKTQKLGIINE